MEPSKRRRIMVFTHPRSASHLLLKLLNEEGQPDCKHSELPGYFFTPWIRQLTARGLWSSRVQDWSSDDKRVMVETGQTCFDHLESFATDAAAEGKVPFIKEHASFLIDPYSCERFFFGREAVDPTLSWKAKLSANSESGDKPSVATLNVTVIPDGSLRQWTPVFLIRHPVLAAPSWYRMSKGLTSCKDARVRNARSEAYTALYWSRALFDWYTAQYNNGKSDAPLVVDADDIMTEPPVVVKLCSILGLDKDKIQFTWEDEDDNDGQSASIPGGILKGKTRDDIDLATERQKWINEWSEAEAQMVQEWIDAAVPDYEYLKARRVRP